MRKFWQMGMDDKEWYDFLAMGGAGYMGGTIYLIVIGLIVGLAYLLS